MDTVALTVGQQLHLDMSRVVEESLDEDGTITESRLGLTDSPLKVLLETFLIPDYPHSSSTTTHGGLDDDWESVLLDEAIGEIITLDGSFGTGHDGDTSLDS